MKEMGFSRRLWISFGIVIASIAVTAGALYWLSGDIEQLAAQIVSARTNLQGHVAAVANLANLKTQAPIAAQYQGAMQKLMTDQYGMVGFPSWLYKEGRAYGVTANASLQGSATPAQGSVPGSATVSFTIDGAPDKVMTFLDHLRTNTQGYLFTMNSFEVATNGAAESISGQGTLFSR